MNFSKYETIIEVWKPKDIKKFYLHDENNIPKIQLTKITVYRSFFSRKIYQLGMYLSLISRHGRKFSLSQPPQEKNKR